MKKVAIKTREGYKTIEVDNVILTKTRAEVIKNSKIIALVSLSEIEIL